MITHPPRRPAFLFSVVSLLAGLAAGQHDTQALHLRPSRAEADQAFSLEVLGYRWVCGTTFSHLSQSRNGSRLSFRFLPNPPSEPICQAPIPVGPKFAAPALPAGRYEVYATVLVPCQVAADPCDIRDLVERVGILTVGKPETADWFIHPGTVMPGRSFTLQLLNHRYGNCQTSFDSLSLSVQGGRLLAAFGRRTDSGRVCVQDLRPHGPAFRVEGLAAGRYPVDVLEPPSQAARTVDTLWVANTLVTTKIMVGPAAGDGSRGLRRMGSGLFMPLYHQESWLEWSDLRGRAVPMR